MIRLQLRVRGIVQGVGFRPFVHALAVRSGLTGFVRNEGDWVQIEVEGAPEAVLRFRTELLESPPNAARIAEVLTAELVPSGGSKFHVEPSRDPPGGRSFVPADVATCAECLAELVNPADRRYRYPLIACAHCGPRFTVIDSLPYDRERTTMAAFPLCSACRSEYDDPNDRRFHAQSTACPACGPRLTLLDGRGHCAAETDPLAGAVLAVRRGGIVAVKGVGGFHLVCDARSSQAVGELRRRKHRDEKPLAVMVADLEVAGALCELALGEAELLCTPERPIVLLRRRPGTALADAVAPGNPLLGVMLPYTALHYLMLREFGGPLVATSGNRADEPIACADADAVRRLTPIADLFLTHDRAIRSRCDDSVVRVVSGTALPVRRSRGYAPLPLTLPIQYRVPILATGGHLKAVFALGRDRHAVLSQHLGDLDGYDALRAYTDTITDFERLYRFKPAIIAHDLHPDYASTRYARERAAENGVRLVSVQHHHAHMASCMAENGLSEPVIGVTFDGSGYGTDGTAWGGEFLVGDYRGFRRAAHLRPVPQPGGGTAAREPWRMALSYLLDAGAEPNLLATRIEPDALRTVAAMTARRVNAPLTSSAGRLFDAVASLIGVRDRASYEGQAAIELEGLASSAEPGDEYPFALEAPENGALQVDTRSLIGAVAADVRRGVGRETVARRFHSALVGMVAGVCLRLRAETGLNAVVLSGGVFLNVILLTEVFGRLTRERFRVYRHTRVSPGDGGLCLGQLAVAAALENCDDPTSLPP